MKKVVLSGLLVLICTSFVMAQNWGRRNNYPQPVTISGTLQLKDGTIAVVSGNTVYYVPALERFIGFIDELKESGQITVEGYVNDQQNNYVQPSKITINGKAYDLPVTNFAMGPRNLYGPNNNYYGRHGCCW